MDTGSTLNGPELFIKDASLTPGNIDFYLRGNEVMLSIRPEGFYVRGEKLVQDESEARLVYDAMVTWARLCGYVK